MSNNANAGTTVQGRPRIDADKSSDVRDWAKKLDSSPEQIRDAVKAVGNIADNVEMHLKGSRATTHADQEHGG